MSTPSTKIPFRMSDPDICFRPIKEAHASWCVGGRPVILTPDDIITLRLLKDAYAQALFEQRYKSHLDWNKTLETLERILKQVG